VVARGISSSGYGLSPTNIFIYYNNIFINMHIFHKWYYPCNGHRICLICNKVESEDDYGWNPDRPFDWWNKVKEMIIWENKRKAEDESVVGDIVKLLKDAGHM